MEVLIEEGDEIKETDVIAFVKQMKMELEIRSPRAGKVSWVVEVESEDGDDVAEGVLLVELVDERPPPPRLKSKI
jgi:biotin carboxyl carrier protein